MFKSLIERVKDKTKVIINGKEDNYEKEKTNIIKDIELNEFNKIVREAIKIKLKKYILTAFESKYVFDESKQIDFFEKEKDIYFKTEGWSDLIIYASLSKELKSKDENILFTFKEAIKNRPDLQAYGIVYKKENSFYCLITSPFMQLSEEGKTRIYPFYIESIKLSDGLKKVDKKEANKNYIKKEINEESYDLFIDFVLKDTKLLLKNAIYKQY